MSDRIPTGCDAIDDLLGGGFERGAVTQVYGPPAAGKTNVVLSAAIELAARGESALYIDTEGLSVERMEQLVRARTSDASATGAFGGRDATGPGPATPVDDSTGDVPAAGNGSSTGDGSFAGDGSSSKDGSSSGDSSSSGNGSSSGDGSAVADDVADVASRLILTAAHTFEEQEEAVRDAEEFVDAVELIVVDSATGFYRLQRTEQEEGEALRAVGRQLAHLLSLARKHDVAVVYTNQVYTDPDSDRARGLGGHTLDHWSATILRVERFRGGNRRATLEKHRAQSAGESARFQITGEGLSTPTGR